MGVIGCQNGEKLERDGSPNQLGKSAFGAEVRVTIQNVTSPSLWLSQKASEGGAKLKPTVDNLLSNHPQNQRVGERRASHLWLAYAWLGSAECRLLMADQTLDLSQPCGIINQRLRGLVQPQPCSNSQESEHV